MAIRAWMISALVSGFLAATVDAEEGAGISKQYKALKYPSPRSFGTWAILDRDGANRRVEPYLSSLGLGEFGVGTIISPPFSISTDTIRFTICGHDGQGGGQQKNFMALVDASTGQTLERTVAPGSDPMQERSWDVGRLKGRKVRIEAHDGVAAGGFAWLGVGRIDAGPPLAVDFRRGMPEGWEVRSPQPDRRFEILGDGVPFLRDASIYSMVPSTGTLEIPCGFAAERLFFLGCTVARGKPLEIYGHVEILYRSGPPDRFPLMYGYTLDGEGKLPGRSKAMHLHPSSDPFQHYLALGPRAEVIERLRIEWNPEQRVVPRITAITCETGAAGENLEALPDAQISAEEEAWIKSHTITPTSPSLEAIKAEIRRAHRMPP